MLSQARARGHHSGVASSTPLADDDPLDDEFLNTPPGLEAQPHSHSRTPSTGSEDIVSLKRKLSSCDSLKETKISKTSGGRPKAADYDDSSKALIVSAISLYRSNLSTVSAFPDMAKEAEMLGQAWRDTCTQLEIIASITPQIAKLVKSTPLFNCLHY